MADQEETPEGQTSYKQQPYRTPAGAVEILLIRHGASAVFYPGKPFDLVDGQSDPDLAPEGREQAELVAERLGKERIDAIYVTTLRRTVQTAAPLARRLGIDPVVEPAMREVHLGEWEGGLFRVKFTENDPVALRVRTEQRWDVIPGAEPAERFEARIREGIDRIVAAHPEGRVAVFSHGGAIGQALALATGSQPFAFVGPDNCSISRLVVLNGTWSIRGYNDIAHLPHASPAPLT
ncbi:histidine phosphatase family protein [Actinomadura rugatobispora]|uniref:Histidine phosphatase family protein n=1 Tax=Actinomadura rugatobispora TaxID=1994 RepID=A0ABW0ZZL6_9ACTN|nr:histidine phosphatase family protein [Actinomadura rugatobispora]